jgi:pilus assembly protein CpaC
LKFYSKAVFTLALIATVVFFSAHQASAQGKKKEKAVFTQDTSERNAEKISLTLQAGVDKIIDLPFKPLTQSNQSIVVGNQKVVRPVIIPEKQQMILKPLEKGTASVMIRDLKGDVRIIYRIDVTSFSLSKAAREIQEILQDVEGVVVKQIGEKIFLDGELVVPHDMGRIVAITKNYPDVVNLTTFSTVAQKIISEKMEKDIKEQLGLDEVRVRSINCRFFLEGVTDSAIEEARAVEIAKTYAPDLVVDVTKKTKATKERRGKCGIVSFITQKEQPAPPPKKMVKVVTQFVELSKDYFKFFGFKWAPGLAVTGSVNVGAGTTGGLASAVNALTGTIDSLIPKLNKAKASGKARVLETAVGITEDNQDLLISKMTQVPYATTNTDGQTTMNTAQYGLSAKIRPRTVGGEQAQAVQLQVQFSFSVPSGVGAGGVPVITTNDVQNSLTVRDGESAAIAGVIRSGSIWAYNKDPGRQTSSVNPIFTLLRSRQFNTDKSQFVIFVTPILVEDASKGTKNIKRKFRIR